SAAGDPAAVSRLARGTLDFRRRTGARLSPARSAGSGQPSPASDAAPPTAPSMPASPPSAAPGPDESALVISLADFADEWRRLGDRAGRDGDGVVPPSTPLELTVLAEPAAGFSRRRIGMAAAGVALVIAGSGAAYLVRERAAAPAPNTVVAENPPAAITARPPSLPPP